MDTPTPQQDRERLADVLTQIAVVRYTIDTNEGMPEPMETTFRCMIEDMEAEADSIRERLADL